MVVRWTLLVLLMSICRHCCYAQSNSAPEFDKDMSGLALSELTRPNQYVYTLTATDIDGDSITYAIDGDMFRVDKHTGDVYTTRRLDYEVEAILFIVVTAEDTHGNKATAFVQVAVEDANDNTPTFDQGIYENEVPEDLAVGEIVIQNFDVFDIDTENAKLTVNCNKSVAADQHRDACDVFHLNRINVSNKHWHGTLSLNSPLDYEKKSLYQFTATAFDGHNYKTQSIEILVKNIQDSPPSFILSPSPTVKEGLPINSPITRVEAVDGDLLDKRDIVYELFYDVECVDNSMFTIGLTDGNITSTVVLDRESPKLINGFVTLCIKAREVIELPNTYGDDPTTTATTSVRISVLDINDNKPQFDPSTYEVSIPEDIPNFTMLPNLIMTINDLDTGISGLYNFTLLDWQHIFKVSPDNGMGQSTTGIVVIGSSSIDYETGPRKYILNVEALESSTVERLSSISTVTVNILDVNDNYPQFSEDEYFAEIIETAPGGTPVISVEATDIDSGSYGTNGISYSLVGNLAKRFKINKLTGLVTVSDCPTPGRQQCIDFEKKNKYILTVVATDSYGDPNGLSVNRQLTIKILDDNDNFPYFPINREYISYIRELETIPSPKVDLQAIDPDTVGDSLTYNIVSQDPDDLWTIHPATGSVTAVRGVLYNDTPGNQGFFYITVRATDGKYDATYNIKIFVIDINDKTPRFTPDNYRENILEQTPPNSLVLTVLAVDEDSPTSAAGQIDYKIERGAQGKFVIDSRSGEIFTSSDALFDFDAQPEYKFTVLATDRGQPQLTATASVTIGIIDENNKNPYFDSSIQRIDVFENVGLQFSIYRVIADDPDKGSILQFTFTEPKEAVTPEGVVMDRNQYDYTDLFVMELTTGNVITNKQLDRDKASVVTYTMEVVDVSPSIPQTGTGTLIITILEYNDDPPYFLPFKNLTIDEEQPLGSYIMAMQASDMDDAIAGYEMQFNPYNFFAVTFQTGVISINSRIDYEEIQSTSFVVTAFDNGTPQQLSTSATVFVTIRNINDNTPVFDSPAYQVRIPENFPGGRHVITVSASDLDLEDFGIVRYNLTDSRGRFLINPVTGEITVVPGAILDREDTASIAIQVIAYDTPNNPDPNVRRSTTVPVYIQLEDENDNPPRFSKDEYFASIIETIPENTQVLQLFATDPDKGQNANLYFFKENGDDDDFFLVSPRSGHISVGKSLLGFSDTYHFRISVRDDGGLGLNITYANVTIEVLPATNAPPEWIIPPMENMTIFVLESQYLGMLVYEVFARDHDRGLNGVVDYGFYDLGVHTEATKEFRINSVTGVIRSEIIYDREDVDRYDLLLVARDRGDPYLETTRFLTIKILDVNDNPPVFATADGETIFIRFNVEEGQPAGTVFGDVKATDADLDLYAKIYYYIIAGNEESKFAINHETGELRTTIVLDREDQYLYMLDIQATNNIADYTVITSRKKRQVDASIAKVIITISDTNDMPPVFTQEQYYGCISTRAAFGESILRVEATDMDSPGKVDISYSIVEGNDAGIFTVDSDTGLIANIKFLTSGTDKTYNLVIEAQDPTNLARTEVLIFVHEPGQGAKLEIGQPLSEVRSFLDQIRGVLESSTSIDYVCISEITDHQTGDGKSSLRSDVFFSAVRKDGSQFRILGAEELINILEKERRDNKDAYDLIYVRNIETSTEENDYLDGTPVLAVMIVIAVLIFLGLLFIIIAYICIRQSNRRQKQLIETKKLIVNQPVVINPNLNPVYDNRGYEPESPLTSEHMEAEYSQVHKSEPVETVMVTTEIVETSAEPAIIIATDMDEDRDREPSPEPPAMAFAVEAEEDTIEVEIQDSTHSSPVSSRRGDEYRIEADVM